MIVLVPSCSLENHQHIQHFKNLPKPDNQPPAVSRSNFEEGQLLTSWIRCPLLVVLPALCIQAFVINAASQSKHGQMGPPFSILFPHVMRRYRVCRRFPRVSFTAPKICECCSTAETVQPAQKADTESHQPSLPVIGGVVATAPALRKHNQDQSSKETVKTISLELDRVEHGV